MQQGRLGRLRDPVRWAEGLPLVAGLIAFVAVTNRWLGWDRGFDLVQANDERAYLQISAAFPNLPDGPIADQHAQRWVVHWLVGGLADLLGVSPQTAYFLVAAVLVVAVAAVLLAVLIRLEVSLGAAAVALAIFLLNPYALRFYAFAPGYLADLVFDLGLAVALLALVRRSLPLLLVALAAGAMGRQTMLVVAPVAALWIVLAGDWRGADGRRRWLAAAATFLTPVVVYVVVSRVAADFAREGFPLSRLTILDTVMDLPGTAGDLVNHFAHTAFPLVAVAGVLAATLMVVDVRSLPATFWGPLAIGATIVAQVVVLNPDPIAYDYSSTNEPRLAAMALPALVVAVAVGRLWAERASLAARAHVPVFACAGLALLAIASLHQKFTVISTGAAAITFGIQIVAGAGLFLLVWIGDRRSPDAPTEAV